MSQGKCWNKEEDTLLKDLFQVKGVKKWSVIAQKINKTFQYSNKSGKQCRQRYHNSLASSIIKREWSKDEQLQLFKLHDQLGNKWTQIANRLPGRAHNCVKNRFYAEIRKSLRKFNRWQKQLKIRTVKLVKVEGIIKILSLGYKNYQEQDHYKNMSQKCLDIKHQLIYFHQQNPQSQNFKGKLIDLYKSISSLTSELRTFRLGKKWQGKKSKILQNIKMQEISKITPQKSQELQNFSNSQSLQDQVDQQQIIKREKSQIHEQKNQFMNEPIQQNYINQNSRKMSNFYNFGQNACNDTPLVPIQNSYMQGMQYGLSYPMYPPPSGPYQSYDYYPPPPMSYPNYYLPTYATFHSHTQGQNLSKYQGNLGG